MPSRERAGLKSVEGFAFRIPDSRFKRRLVGYKRFEELPVWRDSLELALAIYALTTAPALGRQRSLRDQLERAALSISNNIAEGL